MRNFIVLVLADFLERSRSYSFLIVMFVTMYVAYTFIPEIDANYVTVHINYFRGVNNSAWVGSVTAVMSALLLSIFGFYLMNNSIRRDIETGVGSIIASTKLGNLKYLFSKLLSNFLVLFVISIVVVVLNSLVFFYRNSGNDGYAFEFIEFFWPWVIIVLPCIFTISCLAILFELIFKRRTSIPNTVYFFFIIFVMASLHSSGIDGFLQEVLDFSGRSALYLSMVEQLEGKSISDTSVAIGYMISPQLKVFPFEFTGIRWDLSFLISRLCLILLGFLSVAIGSLFFHRFDLRAETGGGDQSFWKFARFRRPFVQTQDLASVPPVRSANFSVAALPQASSDLGRLSFVLAEWKMMWRKGSRWLLLLSAIAVLALALAPLEAAHRFVLPVLWFLQVARFSDLVSKDKNLRTHHFSYSSYQPLSRLLVSQVFAAFIGLVALALPLIIRWLISGNLSAAGGLLLGAFFIVMCSVFLGIITRGKKFFELFFCFLTYANLNGIPPLDYFASFPHSGIWFGVLAALTSALVAASFLVRQHQLQSD